MDLRTYTWSLPRGGMTKLAEQLGISLVYLSQLAARQDGREASVELCWNIEQATNRAVMRWDLRPHDWHKKWPDLVGSDGAPDISCEMAEA